MNTSKKNEFSNNVNQICTSIDILESNIDKIQKKIDDITKLFYKLSYNASIEMEDTNSYLKFQIELLNIENNYYSNIKKSIKSKFVSEMYNLSESILMLLSSIENINIDQNEEKTNILKKINPLKTLKNELETSSIIEIVNSTLSNLELIQEFVDVFENYITEVITRNKKENIHCNNFKVNLENKKELIKLEYRKFYSKLEELILYFLKCTNELREEMKHQQLLHFLIDKEST